MCLIKTERLTLSYLRLDDADFILKLLNEPEFHKYIGDKGISTIKDANGYLLDGPLTSYKQHGYGLYSARLKDTETPIGICGLKKRDSLDVPDLGYAFLKNHRSNGYATEAARGVLDYAHSKLKINKLAALTTTDNEASVRVLKKLGFKFKKIVKLPEFESASNLFVADL